ncbi:solute carrier organic anion transporter family member, partial [Plakobranchus ocellatus]
MDGFDNLTEDLYMERSASELLQRSQEMRLPLEYLKEEEADEAEDCSSNSGSDQEEKPLVHQRKQDGENLRRKRRKKRKASKRADSDQNDVEMLCGVCGWRPACLQPLASVYTFVTLVGVSYFLSQMAMKSLFSQVVSIERQFNIDSSHSGLFGSAWHLGYSSTILIVGHFARVTHIPFAIGVAGIVNGLLVMAPSFLELYAPYKLSQFEEDNISSLSTERHANQNYQYLCKLAEEETSSLQKLLSGQNYSDAENSTFYLENTTSSMQILNASAGSLQLPRLNKEEGPLNVGNSEMAAYAYKLLLCSLFFQGAINSFRYGALPYVYVDDNVLDKTKTGTYLAVSFVFAELTGPFGDLINGVFSNIPVDLSDTNMSRKDPRFVSAWWLGFLIFGGLSILAAIPIMLLPRRLVPVEQQRKALQDARVSFGGAEHSRSDAVSFKARTEEIKLGERSEESDVDTSDAEYCQLDRKTDASMAEQATNGKPEVMVDDGRKKASNGKPRKIPHSPAHSAASQEHDTTLLGMIKDLPKSLIRIFKSPLYALLVIEMTIIYIPLNGIVWPFRVKYIMFEYNVSMAMTNTAKGLSSALTHIAGTLIGSLMSRRIATNMGYLRLILITAFLSWLVTSLLMYFGCDNRNIVGLNGVMSADATSCGCDATLNLLSCGSDGLTYLSPCHAGCAVTDAAIFTNCSSLTSTDQPGVVSPGICDVGCFDNFIIFNVLTATQTFIFSINNMPRHLLALRILEPKDRAFGSAFLHFAPFIASLPAPYIFGKWMEQMCLVWSSDHCSLYDRDEI